MSAVNVMEIVVGIALYVLYVIGLWKMFEKAGRRKWLSIIPIVNTAVLCLIGWKRIRPFVLEIVFGFGGAFVALFASFMRELVIEIYDYLELEVSPMGWTSLMIAGIVLIVITLIIYIIMLHRVSCAFGHGAGFTVGQVFVPYIIYPVIGWGSSEYIDEQEKNTP